MIKNFAQNSIVHILIVFVTAIFSFLPTLEMFFYLDEWGNIYEFTHGQYDFTIFTAHMIYLLFSFFGTNATGYFAVGLFIYALSAVAVYFFVSRLLSNKLIGFISGLIYGVSPVGSDTVIMIWTYVIEGGYPLTIGLLLVLYLLLIYFQKGKIIFYLVALLGFAIFLELEPRRVFLYLPVIMAFDYLMHFRKILIPDFWFFLRQTPFVVFFVLYYKYSVTLSNILATGKINLSDAGYDSQTKIELFLNSFFDNRPYVTLANILLGSFSIFPKEFISLASLKYTNFWIFLVLSIAAILVIIGWKVKRIWGILIVFSLVWIFVNIIGIYVFSSPGISETTHRTLSLSAPAYGIFITLSGFSVYELLKNKLGKKYKNLDAVFTAGLILFLGFNILAVHTHFQKFNDWRSKTARAFFKEIKMLYPTFPKNSLLYIETPENPQVKYTLSRIYGGNNLGACATIAAFYPDLHYKEIDIVRDIKDVSKFVASDSARINNVFAFYFDEKGLRDQTNKFRSEFKLKSP